jgi:hypothetical protein
MRPAAGGVALRGIDWGDVVGYWFAESTGEFVCPECITVVDLRTRPHVIWTWDDDVTNETGPLVCDRCQYRMMEKGESPAAARRRWQGRVGA